MRHRPSLNGPGRGLRALLVAAFVAGGCGGPRTLPALPATFAMAAPDAGPLTDLAEHCAAGADMSESGFLLLSDARDALDWRLALIDSAVQTLDLQTYIWQSDDSGSLVAMRLHAAAERGVRIRLLLDDFRGAEHDDALALINTHPNIEVRIFNPWSTRGFGRNLEFLARMEQLNCRMHNKILVADDLAAISGGRNIGNEYFGLSDHFNFDDLDLLAIGPVARELSDTFDYYWNSNWVGPASDAGDGRPEQLALAVGEVADRLERSERLSSFEIAPRAWDDAFAKLPARLVHAPCEVVFDRLIEKHISVETAYGLRDFFAAAEEEILIANAYLVPGDSFVAGCADLTSRSVRVVFLTNSLGSTDAAIVNSAYGKSRLPLLRAGVELYELRHDAEATTRMSTPPVTPEFVSLHTKAAIVDRHTVFVGSFNLTPRSVSFNTEMGLFIRSPELAAQLARLIEGRIGPANAWQVEIGEKGLRWRSGDEIHATQPARTFFQQFENGFFAILPLRDQI